MNAKTEQQDFFFSFFFSFFSFFFFNFTFLATGGREREVGWLIDYLLGINTERVYAKAEGTMPSSQNKTLTAN